MNLLSTLNITFIIVIYLNKSIILRILLKFTIKKIRFIII